MDKRVEHHRLLQFLDCIGREGLAESVQPGESPDFIVKDGDVLIGIEHTQLTTPRMFGGASARQVREIRDEILRGSQKRYVSAGGVPIDISVDFRPAQSIARPQRLDVARFLAEYLQEKASVSTFGSYITLAPRHPAIHSIGVTRVATWEHSLWHEHGGGWVSSPSVEDLQHTIASKERALPAYRKRATSVWLLIVCDLVAEDEFIAAPPMDHALSVTSEFDRIFCLDWMGRRCPEIPIAGKRETASQAR